MINRLLEQLQPRRRHLTILVGLLVLTFVLTFVLAHQARSAEIERQRVVQTRLHEVAEGIVVEWSRKFQMFVHNEVSPVVRPLSAAARDPQLALEVYAAFARQFGFCDGCSGASAGSRFFALEHGTVVHAIGELPDTAVLTAVWREAADGRFAPLSDWFGIALYITAAGGDVTPVAAVVQMDTAFNPVRLYGALLTERRATEMLQYAFGTGGFVATLGSSLPQDSLFSLAAVVGGVSLLGPVPETNAAAHSVMPDNGPVPGVTLHVGLLPSVEQLLVLSPPSSARVPLFGALLAIIGGLIVLALLLVRRESELVRLRAEFISGVSHEFRTPLAQIRMFAEMLLLGRARSDVERRRSLEIIDQEAQRLTHLIENTLAYSKAEAGRQRIKPEPLSLPDEVRRAVEIFTPLCRSRQVEVRCEIEEQICASVDPGALRQMLLNVLDNALKYGPIGQRITVGLALFGEAARVWVDDEGPGIPRAEREHVFEPFFRLRRDAAGRTGGSGIGLSVVREIARLHGGTAWAESAPGGGTRILMQFPDAYLRDGAVGLPAAS